MPAPGQAQRAASKFIVFEQFEKMNTQSVRQALSEKELAWLENLQPIAPNNLTTVPAPFGAITNISETVTSQYFANLGATDYIVSFTSVGSGWITDLTGINTRFALPGTFTNPDMTVWQSGYILINDPTAGYSAYNGMVYVRQGGVSPLLMITAAGTGYTSAPTVTISGGTGSGATAVATVGTPAVLAVNIVTGGSGYTSAPTVHFAGGGGSGATATAQIDPRGLTSISITNAGKYTLATVSVSFSGGGGSGAAATAVLTNPGGGAPEFVSSITITSAGSGYASPPTVTINLTSGGQTVQATATCTVGAGQVTGVTITAGGSAYTSAPSVTFTGGGGSGATATAVIGGSGILTLTLTNPGSGYLASDVLTVGFSGGGGSGATATAHVWPFVPAGTTLAVFQGRVWLGGNRILQWTGTAGFDDFSAANASGSLAISDADLVHTITALRNYNNYLFIMGDQSVKQIGNISLNNAGNVTLFTILTLSSDQGTIYPRSCGSFNRVFFFCNSNGIYAVFGSSVQKVSDDLDGIFKLIDFTQQPQAGLVDINNIHNIAWLVKYKDPLASPRAIMLTFTGKKWFVVSQGDGLVTIVTASTVNPGSPANGQTRLFGSSGTDITQLLTNSAIPVAFRIQSALTHHGNAVQRKATIRQGFAVTAGGSSTITVGIDSDEASQAATPPVVAGFQTYTFANPNVSGTYLGMTITGTQAGFTMTNMRLEYQETNVGNKS